MKGFTVYRDFFLNTSVAWFSSGVISLGFISLPSNQRIIYTLGSAIFTFLFLQVAVIIDSYDHK